MKQGLGEIDIVEPSYYSINTQARTLITNRCYCYEASTDLSNIGSVHSRRTGNVEGAVVVPHAFFSLTEPRKRLFNQRHGLRTCLHDLVGIVVNILPCFLYYLRPWSSS